MAKLVTEALREPLPAIFLFGAITSITVTGLGISIFFIVYAIKHFRGASPDNTSNSNESKLDCKLEKDLHKLVKNETADVVAKLESANLELRLKLYNANEELRTRLAYENHNRQISLQKWLSDAREEIEDKHHTNKTDLQKEWDEAKKDISKRIDNSIKDEEKECELARAEIRRRSKEEEKECELVRA